VVCGKRKLTAPVFCVDGAVCIGTRITLALQPMYSVRVAAPISHQRVLFYFPQHLCYDLDYKSLVKLNVFKDKINLPPF
jgi:hypothetical protein